MVPVGVVHVTTDEVVDVVAVWHRLVPAAGPVLVSGLVLGAVVLGCAVGGVDIADRNCVTLDGGARVVVQLAVTARVPDGYADVDRGRTRPTIRC